MSNADFISFRRSNRPAKFNRHEGCSHKRTQGSKPRNKK